MRLILLRVALVAGLLFSATQVVEREVFHFRAGDLSIKLEPAIPGGDLELSLGPFGHLTWSTHTAPIDVSVSFLLRPTAQSFPNVEEFRDLRWAFLLRKLPWLVVAGALIGALTVGAHADRRRWFFSVVGGAAATTLFALGAIGAAAATFDAGALRDPRYRGPIRDAPRVLQLLKEVQRDWAGIQHNINRAVGGLQRLHDQIVGATPEADPVEQSVRLLVVSDLHNNPLGMLLANELAERFAADAVLDAGDFTDRGTAIEAELFARFQRLDTPYIIAPGNHEDQPTLRRLRRLPNVRVLTSGADDVAEVQGVTILGADDPNAHSIDSNPRNAAAEEQLPARCEALRVRTLQVRPDVLIVHDPRLSACAKAAAREQAIPLVAVEGHTHRQSYGVDDGVVVVNPGTSGANGFKSDVVTAYGFALLEFDPETHRTTSICLFQFDDPSRLRLSSCHLDPTSREEQAPPSPSPSPSPSPTGATPTPEARAADRRRAR